MSGITDFKNVHLYVYDRKYSASCGRMPVECLTILLNVREVRGSVLSPETGIQRLMVVLTPSNGMCGHYLNLSEVHSLR